MVCNANERYAERELPENILDDFPAVKGRNIFFKNNYDLVFTISRINAINNYH